MSAPASGYIKIFPTDTIINSGDFALNSDASPQPDRPASDLDTYYNARVTNLAVAPCFRRNPVNVVLTDYELQFDPSSIGFEFYSPTYPGPIVDTINFLNGNFPVGMVIIQPRLWWTGQIVGAAGGTNLDFKYFGSTIHSQSVSGGAIGSFATGINDILAPSIRWSLLQVMKYFGFHVNYNVASAIGCITSEFFLLCQYNTLTWSFTNSTPNVLPGGIVDLTEINAKLGDFDINNFKIYWDTLEDETDVNPNFPGWTGGILIPRYLILEFTSTHFRFIMPSNIPYGGRRLMLTGTGVGTQFVGEFPIQNFNITLVDGSGLYTLVEDQHHDTYYDRSVSPVVTTDLKIPDPFAKTGFIP